MIKPEIESKSPGPLADTLPNRTMGRFKIYINKINIALLGKFFVLFANLDFKDMICKNEKYSHKNLFNLFFNISINLIFKFFSI